MYVKAKQRTKKVDDDDDDDGERERMRSSAHLYLQSACTEKKTEDSRRSATQTELNK